MEKKNQSKEKGSLSDNKLLLQKEQPSNLENSIEKMDSEIMNGKNPENEDTNHRFVPNFKSKVKLNNLKKQKEKMRNRNNSLLPNLH